MDVPVIHNLHSDDANKIKLFFSAKQGVINILNQKAEKLKQISIFVERIRNTEVRSGSNSDAIQKLYDEKKLLLEEIGGKKERIRFWEQTIQENKRKIETLNREITNWKSRAELKEVHQKQYEYCDKIHNTIKEFQNRFQISKTSQLEQEILFMWGQLTHKPDLIHHIKILPESNFEVKLYNAQSTEVDKTKLSAGEKEIYAIALLWALIQVSGKKLPIIIDTPFGRLDSIHRRNLTKNYFPKASHQVILLSQDEEVVGEYYQILKPCIAQELTIKNENGVSSISSGYPFTNGL
jgi:DNA sulfur modification protein DndD